MQESNIPITVADHELITKIGNGSYGDVWLAKNQLGRFRAIKIVRADKFETLRPFKREYEGIKRFEPISRKHLGLMPILQVGQDPGGTFFYYVMEAADDVSSPQIDPSKYIPRTLAREVASKGVLPVRDCVHIGIELALALDFLHEQGLIHRDIKPSNVVFMDGQPKLADIGLVADMESANTYVGTPGFIAPEGPNSAQADIYSLGKLLYEISTGKDRNEFPALPDEFPQEFSELNEVMVKACHFDPRKRHASAAQVAAELRLIQEGRSVRRLHYLEKLHSRAKSAAAVAAVFAGVLVPAILNLQKGWRLDAEERNRRIGSLIAHGTTLLQQGDLLTSLPVLIDAYKLDKGNDHTSSTHRLRIGSVLAVSPRKIATWKPFKEAAQMCNVHGDHAIVTWELKGCYVIDLNTGKIASEFLGNGWWPMGATFHPDGNAVLLANWDKTARLLDWRKNRVLIELQHSSSLQCASISPDGKRIVTGCADGGVYVWNTTNGALLLTLKNHDQSVTSCKFSPSGRLIVTTSKDRTALICDSETGRRIVDPLRHSKWVFNADFSPDEQVLATASQDLQVRLWDIETGREDVPPLRHNKGVYSVRFSKDGSRILTGGLDGSAMIWDARWHRPVELNSTLRHSRELLDAAFVGENRIITTAVDGSVTLWDLKSDISALVEKAEMATNKIVTRSSDGQWDVKLAGKTLRITNLKTAKEIPFELSDQASIVRFDRACRRLLAVAGANLYSIDLLLGSSKTYRHRHPITSAEFSPDGTRIACATTDTDLEGRSARLLDASTCQPIGLEMHHTDGINSLAFSHDGRWLATASEDFSAMVWDASSGVAVTEKLIHREKVFTARFAHQQPWVVTASGDGTAIIWDRKTGDQLTLPFKHNAPLNNAFFSEDDTVLITIDDLGYSRKWPIKLADTDILEQAMLKESQSAQ